MAQKRYYALTTTNEATGLQRTAYVCAHSPADFLKHATMSAGEKAQAGKLYAMPNGETLMYGKATKADFDAYTQSQARNAAAMAESFNAHSDAEAVVAKAAKWHVVLCATYTPMSLIWQD